MLGREFLRKPVARTSPLRIVTRAEWQFRKAWGPEAKECNSNLTVLLANQDRSSSTVQNSTFLAARPTGMRLFPNPGHTDPLGSRSDHDAIEDRGLR
jgi:hypothetical protein